jgi:hypothetical protein
MTIKENTYSNPNPILKPKPNQNRKPNPKTNPYQKPKPKLTNYSKTKRNTHLAQLID